MDPIDVVRAKEVRAAYKSFFAVCWSVGIISALTLAYMYTQPESSCVIDPISMMCPVLMSSTVGVLWLFRHSPASSQRLLLFVLSEVYLWGLKGRQLYNVEQRVVHAALASIFLLNFQVKLAYTSLGSVLLAGKHLIQWVCLDIYTYPEYFPSLIPVLVPLAMSVAHIVSHFHYTNELRNELVTSTRLHTSHQRLNAMVEALPDGILVLSAESEVLMINRNADRVLPYKHLPPLERLKHLRYIKGRRLVSRQEEPVWLDIWPCFEGEVGVTTVLGSVECAAKYIEIQVSKVDWGSTPAVMVLFRDITAIIQLETKETENACQLQLLKFVSHELTTPTVSIIGFAETMMKTSSVPGTEVILASAKMLLLLIGNIVDYTKLLMSDFSLHKRDICLTALIRETCGLICQQAEKKSLDYIVRIDPALPEQGYTDPSRFAQVLLILLTKALKFTSSGRIEVVFTMQPNSNLRVTVTDTGIGIPEQRLDQLKRSLSTFQPSSITKLGLEMANMLVKTLGNKGLRIQSKLYEGTSIQYEVQLTNRYVRESTPKLQDVLSGCSERKELICIPASLLKAKQPDVLIVDDNDFNRMALVNILAAEGMQCVEARNGLEAVQVVEARGVSSNPIKTVLMDISMPVMNGWKACKLISELAETQVIPAMPSVIAYTALNSTRDIQQCYDSGMVCYLHKPAPAEEILKTLRYFAVC